MLALFRWNLVLRRGVPLAVGIVSGHPKQAEGVRVHTSPVLRAAFAEDCLTLETASGRTYYLALEDWDPSASREAPLDPELLGLPPDFWTSCAQARDDAAASQLDALEASGKPGTLFLRTVGASILSAFWLPQGLPARSVPVLEHLGMFQDSCLIIDGPQDSTGTSQLDFRLFPGRNYLEPYQISPGLDTLLLCNDGCCSLSFSLSGETIMCAAKSVTSIPIQAWGGN